MAWIRADNLRLVAGDHVLVSQATFRIDPGDRVGLIGPNGMGKTTLFRVLRGDQLPDGGHVERSTDLVVASLDQLPRVDAPTVYDVASRAHLTMSRLEDELRTLEAAMADPHHPNLAAVLDRYAAVQEAYQSAGGYDWDVRVRRTLLGAGIPEHRFGDPPASLSGGERHRLHLATVLLSGANLWLLDEPTNHLDVSALEWLEDALAEFPGGVLLASHDRRFLERAVNRIMTWEDGFFWMVSGSYRQYVAQREERRRATAQSWQRYQEERARLMAYVERYRAGNRATQAKSRLHAVARLDREAVRPAAATRSAPRALTHQGHELSGAVALVVDDLVLQRGERTWPPLTFKLPTGARLGIAGPNGAGKTTLIEALVRHAHGVRWHSDAQIAWYDQNAAALLPDTDTGLSLAHDEGMDRETAYHLGARFGLSPDLLNTPLVGWSGGERSRLALLFALMARSTVLILDEPTNHCDLSMRVELEQLLAGYPGALIVVSHDREFLDNVVTHMLWWDGSQFRFRAGTYSTVAGH